MTIERMCTKQRRRRDEKACRDDTCRIVPSTDRSGGCVFVGQGFVGCARAVLRPHWAGLDDSARRQEPRGARPEPTPHTARRLAPDTEATPFVMDGNPTLLGGLELTGVARGRDRRVRRPRARRKSAAKPRFLADKPYLARSLHAPDSPGNDLALAPLPPRHSLCCGRGAAVLDACGPRARASIEPRQARRRSRPLRPPSSNRLHRIFPAKLCSALSLRNLLTRVCFPSRLLAFLRGWL